jgi:Uma2 family endonuclease
MAEPARKPMTVDEFLRWEDGSDTRYELVDGEIVAMAPATDRHGTIAANLTTLLGTSLQRPCRVVVEAGVQRLDRNDRFYHADIAVTCAPPSGTIPVPEPRVIVEVLSPSTEAHDRGHKVPNYREIPSVAEILLVSSRERNVEHWRRSGTAWVVSKIEAGPMELASVGVTLDIDGIYDATGL